MADLPRTSINESSADYELIQPGADRIESEYSTQEITPAHLRVPPKPHPPIPHRKPLPNQPRHYRLTPKAKNRLSHSRQRNYRLSQSPRRNYAELQGKRDTEVHYDVPNHYSRGGGAHTHYDAFFAGSLDDQSFENNETYRQTLVEPKSSKSHCKCSRVVVKNVLAIVIVIVSLLVALAALGLVLHMKIVGHHHHSTSSDRSTDLQCSVTMTMNASGHSVLCMANTTCTIMTESLPINKVGFTSPRFHCEATYDVFRHHYNNSLYRDSESAHCVCQFEATETNISCTIVGDYCMEQDI